MILLLVLSLHSLFLTARNAVEALLDHQDAVAETQRVDVEFLVRLDKSPVEQVDVLFNVGHKQLLEGIIAKLRLADDQACHIDGTSHVLRLC